MITCIKCHETLTEEDYMDECECDNSIHKWVHKCYNPTQDQQSINQASTSKMIRDMFADFDKRFGGFTSENKDDENGKDE